VPARLPITLSTTEDREPRRTVDLKRLTNRAKDLVDKRGGVDSVKQDASELRGIAKRQGSLKDKAKAAAEAIKQPGAEPEKAKPAASPDDGRGEQSP
jgi:hypothetical protein